MFHSVASADLALFGQDRLALHIGTPPRSFAPYVLIVGDPERAERIAQECLTDCRQIGNRRGMMSFTGIFNSGKMGVSGSNVNVPLSVSTHQMGWPLAARAITEMAACGGRRFIRVGSCSSFRPEAQPGDIAVWKSAYRLDPSIADCWVAPNDREISATPAVTQALTDAAVQLGVRYHVGSGVTASTFDQGQGRPGLLGYIPRWYKGRMRLVRRKRFVGMEMEMATLLAFGQAHRGLDWAVTEPATEHLMVGGVTAIYANRWYPSGELKEAGMPEAIRVALLALVQLHLDHPINPITVRHVL